MATLRVRNIPDDRYEALRKRARENRRSIAAEVILLLEQWIPTAGELRERRRAIRPAHYDFTKFLLRLPG